ncbi:ESPR-type extended signal peptide-containing protein [Acinetobacter gerneri]|uniref:ESPR-type extended signal peptide-containing protein n=1 Tax=Acinetobacter gerneri TaxID=202952 RepID=UPI003A8C479B
MNKVYKIVWNKALGVWVVVSELAKAGKKSSKVTVVGGILVLSAVQLSHAEMVITDSNGTSIIAGDGLYIENGPTLSREVFDANGLYLANLADGLVTASSQDGINGSQLYNSMSNVATAIGKSALIDSNTGEITVRNVAGTNQNTIDDAISFVKTTADNALKTANLGLNFSTNGANPSNIPLGGMVDFSNGKNTTATYNSSTKSYQYSVVDAPNFAGKVTAQGFDASNQVISNVANGVAPNDAVNVAQLKAQQTHYYSVNDNGSTGANYNNDGATGKNAIASGVGAVSNSENGVAIGSNVNAEAVLTPINGPTTGDIAIGSNSKAAGGIVVGSNSSTKGIGNEVVLGNNNAAVNQNFNNRSSVAIGYNNSSLNGGVAIGANGVAKDNAVAVGYNTSAGFNSVAIGDGSNSADYAIAIGSANAVGTNSVATGLFAFTQGENAVAVGRGAAGIGANAVALGNTAVALGDNTTALGNATNVSVDKGVALGASSVSNTAAGAAGYDPKTSAASTDTTSTWKSTAGAVSIGDSANNITRQITGVAAGSQDTDAVNLAQLKAVKTLASSGWTATDGTTPANIGPSGSVKFTGDNNVAVQQTGTDNNAEIAVNLNKNIDLTENGSVAVGDTLVNSEGLSITNGPSFTATGIDAAGLYIANVGDGLITAQSKDAVNGSQLYAAQSNLADLIGPSAMIDSGTGEVTAKNIGGTTSSTIDGAIGIVKTTADTALTTANKGLNFAVNGSTATNLPLGSTLNMADGENTKATFDPVSKTYKYDVVDAPVFAGKVTAQGLDASSNKIENVAAGQADTDAVNLAQLKAQETHYYSVNDGGTQGSNYNNDGATGTNALAAGVNSTASATNGIAMGNGAIAASANNSIAIGNAANVQTLSGIAIGSGASVNAKNTAGTGEGYWGVALGNNSSVTGEYGVAIGGGNVGSGAGGGGSNNAGVHGVAVGYNSNAGYNGTALGYMANAPGNYSSILEGGYSVAVGYKATTGTFGYGTALGSFSNSSGIGSVSLGNNSTSSGTGSVALGGAASQGNGAQATGSSAIAIGGAGILGSATKATGTNSIAMGGQANVAGANSIGIGASANVANKNTVAVGNSIKSTQDNSVLLGNATTDRAATVETGMVIAGQNQNFAGKGSVASGVVSVGGKGTERQIINVAAGNVSATSTDAVNGSQLFAVTNGLSNAGTNYVADNATTVHKNLGETLSVLGGATGELTSGNIGVNSDANGNLNIALAKDVDLGDTGSLKVGQTLVNNDGVAIGNDVNLTASGLKVGTIVADATTGKITGLTAGTVASDSKDAINGSQLYGVSDSFKTVIGGNAAVNPDGTVTTSNIGGTGKDNVNDAIQAIDITAKAAKSTVIAGKNTLVTPTTNPDGSTEYKVETADDVDFNSVTVGAIRADASSGKITGLTAGTVASDSKDAINGSQLYGVSDSFKTVIGGNAAVNPDGTVTTSNIGGTGKDNVNDAIQAIDTTAKAAKSTVIAGKNTLVTPSTNPDGSTEYKVETADDVDFNSVTASSLTVGSINADATTGKITGLTAGTVASDSKDAINGSQLYGVSDSFKTVIGGNAAVNPDGTVTTSNIGGTGKDNVNDAIQAIDTTAKAAKSTVVAGKNTLVTPSTNPDGSTEYKVETAEDVDFNSVTASSLTVGSINADATTGKITGLTAGTVASDSKDAINGSQLYGVSDSFKTVIGGNAAVNPDGTVTTSNIGGTGKDNVNDAIQAIDTTAKAAKSTVIARKNTLVTPTTNPDGSMEYKVETADDVDFNSVTVGAIRADATTGKITGLTAGTVASDSKDAINGSQLYGVSDSFKTVLGGNAAVNPDGTVTTSNIGGTGKDNVNDAIQAIDTTAKAAKSTVIAGKNTLVTPSTNPDGSTEYKVETADDVDFNSVTVGTIRADASSGKITGLTAGTVASDSKDAINGSQLYGVSDSFKTVIGGNAAVNPDGTITTSNIGGTGKDNVNDAIQAIDTTAKAAKSTVIAGKNTLVTPSTNPDGSTEYKVETADDVDFNSVTASSLTVGSINADASTGKITGLTAGTVASDSKDAINGSQLYGVSDSFKTVIGGNAVVNPDGTVTTSNIGGTGKDNVNDAIQAIDTTAKAAKSTVIAGKNTLVTPTTNADGSTEYKVETADDVDFNSVTVGTIRADATTGKITGLTAGTVASDSKDAINGSQLYGVSDSFKTVIGGNAVVNPDGTVTTSNIGGTGKDNVNDAIQAIDTTAKAAKSTVIAGKNTLVTPSTNPDGSTEYKVETADDVEFNSVTVGAIRADTTTGKITGLTAGTVASDSKDAINGSQLYSVSDSFKTVIGGNAAVNPDGTVTTSNIGGTGKDNVNDAIQAIDTTAKAAKSTVIAGKNTLVTPTTNADGSTEYKVATADDVDFNSVTASKLTVGSINADAATGKIVGVSDGLVAANSLEVVNGGQLFKVADSFKTVVGGNAIVNPDGTINVSNIGGTGKDNVNDAIQAIDTTAKAAKSTVVASKNTIVTSSKNADGSTEYAVATVDDVNFKSVTASSLTVGSINADATTGKITGLTAGTVASDSKDAINGSQLYGVSDSFKTVIGGNAVVNPDGTVTTSNIGGTGKDNVNDAIQAIDTTAKAAKSTVIAGKNTLVTPSTNPDGSTEYKVETADDVDFNSVTASSLTVGSINADASTGKITGLTAGTVASDSKDAINGSQLYGVSDSFKTVIGGNAVVNPDGTVTTSNIGGTGKDNVNDAIQAIDTTAKAAKSTVVAGKNTLVTPTTNPDGSTEYKVATADDVDFNSVTSDKITVGNIVADASSNKISGLANGAVSKNSTEAINGSQLYGVSNSVSTVIGGNSKVNVDGTLTVSNLGNTGKNNVNDAIAAVQNQATQAKSTVSSGDNIVVNETKNADGSTNYQVETAKDVSFDTVKSDQVTVGNIKLDSSSNKITGIENGTVSKDSKDAINGSQLSSVSNSVANVIGGNTKVNSDGTLSANDIGGTGKNTVDEAIASVKSDVSAAKTTVSAGTNTVVNKNQNTDGSTNYTVDLAKDIAVDSVTAKDVKADNVQAKNVTADNVKVGNVTVNSTTNKVSGLANGEVSKTSTDAVNGSQLHATNQNMATYLGGGSTVNTDGSTSAPTYNVAGGSYHDVGSALNAVDGRVSNLEQAFYQTNQNMQDLRNETRAGIAGALAVGNLPQPTEAGMSMISAGVGGYRGETAVAVGVSAITDSNKYVWKMGASADSRSNISGAVSVGYQWK